MRAYRLPIVLAGVLAAGCAPGHYEGIPLSPGAAPSELQALASAARAGEQTAQLELGRRFEAGNGVPQDLETARDLYRKAARDSGGTQLVYVPDSGSAGGRVVPFDKGPARGGLLGAKLMLARPARPERGIALGKPVPADGVLTPSPRGLDHDAFCASIASAYRQQFGSDELECNAWRHQLQPATSEAPVTVYELRIVV